MQDSDLNEYYSAPENILNVSVCNPCTQTDGSEKYTDYEIICKTNMPIFRRSSSVVRRRYRDFKKLREILVQENPNVKIPELPPMRIFSDKFQGSIINERIIGLTKFLKQICTHPVIQGGPSARLIVSFIQDPSYLY